VELAMHAHAGIAGHRVQSDHSAPKLIDLVIRAGHRWH
jgi:hypothetical protein